MIVGLVPKAAIFDRLCTEPAIIAGLAGRNELDLKSGRGRIIVA